jgi:Na+/melibiose symporter-like transporter
MSSPQPISVKPTDFDSDVEATNLSQASNLALGDKPKKKEVTLGDRTTRGARRGSFLQIFSSRGRGNSLFEVMTRRRSTTDAAIDTDAGKMPGNPTIVDMTARKSTDMGAGTALAPGGEVDIFELRNIGFILQYFAIGIIYGGLPATIYGLFLGYLSVPGYVYATAGVITTLPWSFKFFFGMLNDCVPIFGYRRKPYMVIGWALCCAMLLFISTHSLPDPYYCFVNGTYLEDEPPCNPSAKEKGGEYAMLMCLAALGYVVADVGADGLMVQYAQREPQATRGQTQTMIYLVRTLGVVVATALVGLCMNGKEYNGTFDWTLSYNQICGILAVPAGVMVPVSWFLVQEEKVRMAMGGGGGTDGGIIGDEANGGAPTTFRGYLRQSWELLSSKAFFYVVLFNFFEPFVGRISTTAGGYVKSEWAGVKSLQNQMFSLVSSLVFAFGLYQVKKRFLNYSWRKMLAITLVMLNATDMIIAFLTIFDVVRNQYFYLGETILDEIPAAANFVVGTYIIVEMADVGNEGLTYGLLTTISNLGSPFARAVGNQIFGAFRQNLSERQNYVDDSPEFRRAVAWSFAMSYGFSFAALGFLVLLPRQKEEAQLRKATWGRSPTYAYITVCLLLCALCYSLSVNFLAMFPDTMCLKFAGGSGCGGGGGGGNSTSV